MSDDDRFRPDLKGVSRRAFEKSVGKDLYANRTAAANATGVDKIMRETAKVREKLRAHMNRNRDHWINKEVKRLVRKSPPELKLSLSGGPKPPAGAQAKAMTHMRALREKAAVNVHRRCNIRLHTLDKIERRMTQKLMRNQTRNRNR
ncbi:MAG: hypothetical protein AAGD92_16010 [Pseudomonadota bacterium]